MLVLAIMNDNPNIQEVVMIKFYVESPYDENNQQGFQIMAMDEDDDIDDREIQRVGTLKIVNGVAPSDVIEAIVNHFYPEGFVYDSTRSH